MTAQRLDRVGLNVGSVTDALRFYEEALGFTASPVRADPACAALLGVRTVQTARLQRGAQVIELTQCDPPGAPYPEGSHSNDAWFQHCALVTGDMASAYARLCAFPFTPISRHGPVLLPGGITAFKFRDPDGHPLELIQFPRSDPLTEGGIDHSAIAVADVARSVAFYAGELGLVETARQVNKGPAQDALDGLDGVSVDVVALMAQVPAPHLELLCYRTPRGRSAGDRDASAIAASRLVFSVGTGPLLLRRDPDGHLVVLEG